MKRTQTQNRNLHAELTRTGLMEQKESLAFSFSNKRTSHTSDLSVDECKALISHLKQQPDCAAVQQRQQGKVKKMRSKVLHLASAFGMAKGDSLDWNFFNNFMLKKSVYRKKLTEYTAKELPFLITQFEQMVKHKHEQEANKAVAALKEELGL